LARAIERGDRKARQRLIEANQGLVFSIAVAYVGSGVQLADLVQDGMVGLVNAAERFDHRRRARFSTYAALWVRRAILDAIVDARMIRIPAKARQQLAAVRRAESELGRTGLERVTDASIAGRTGLTESVVRNLRGAPMVAASLDEPAGDADHSPRRLQDRVSDPAAVDPLEHAIAREQRDALSAQIRLLPARHREVLTRRYGLDHHREESHREIAERLGLGVDRTRQLEHEALRRLRAIQTPQ